MTEAVRRSRAALMRPVHQTLRFAHFKNGVYLLHDWSAFENGLEEERARFGLAHVDA